ncbi:hypothetical protein GCM10010104_50530 [Streptomyces indiaensis]|uniref:Uncharacterized protein n=1 Tax=Streptomyces indiaensis TaxID=284033 RepID=A0ABP5QZI9_9ACTN
MKVLSVVGARPQFVKPPPIAWHLTRRGDAHLIVHTVQGWLLTHRGDCRLPMARSAGGTSTALPCAHPPPPAGDQETTVWVSGVPATRVHEAIAQHAVGCGRTAPTEVGA